MGGCRFLSNVDFLRQGFQLNFLKKSGRFIKKFEKKRHKLCCTSIWYMVLWKTADCRQSGAGSSSCRGCKHGEEVR